MSEVEIDFLGGSASEIFEKQSPSSGDRIRLDEGLEAEYKRDLVVKSIEGEAFRFVIHHSAEFGTFATYATLYKVLEKSGAKAVTIANERVEVDKEAIKERLEEVLED